MRQADRFDQVFVGAQRPRQRTADLRHFQCVGQARSIIIAGIVDEDLRFVFEKAKGSRVHDAIAIALKGGAVARFRLVMQSSARMAAEQRISGERIQLIVFQLQAKRTA